MSRWLGGRLGWRLGRATNAIMTQVVAARNGNAIIMIFEGMSS